MDTARMFVMHVVYLNLLCWYTLVRAPFLWPNSTKMLCFLALFLVSQDISVLKSPPNARNMSNTVASCWAELVKVFKPVVLTSTKKCWMSQNAFSCRLSAIFNHTQYVRECNSVVNPFRTQVIRLQRSQDKKKLMLASKLVAFQTSSNNIQQLPTVPN